MPAAPSEFTTLRQAYPTTLARQLLLPTLAFFALVMGGLVLFLTTHYSSRIKHQTETQLIQAAQRVSEVMRAPETAHTEMLSTLLQTQAQRDDLQWVLLEYRHSPPERPRWQGIAHTEGQLPLPDATRLQAAREGSASLKRISQGGQTHLSYLLPLPDSNGTPSRALLGVMNMSADMERDERETILVLGVALLGLLLGGFALWQVLTRQLAPLHRMGELARDIARGEHTRVLDLQQLRAGNLEMQQMIEAVHHMAERMVDLVGDLEARVAEKTADIRHLNEQLHSENRRMGAELDIQRHLHEMLLPRPEELAALSGLDAALLSRPAQEVSGDYLDLFPRQDGATLAMGDVTGHGLESGVVMLMTQSILRAALLDETADNAQRLERLNRALYDNLRRAGIERNLSLCLLDFRPQGEGARLSVTGQHETLLIARADGRLETLDTDDLGFPLGLLDDIAPFIDQRHIELQAGDVVLLYTDGVTEAENPQGEFYGQDGLARALLENRHRPVQALLDALLEDIDRFGGGRPQQDDISLIALKSHAHSRNKKPVF